jgi:hypothetical protein
MRAGTVGVSCKKAGTSIMRVISWTLEAANTCLPNGQHPLQLCGTMQIAKQAFHSETGLAC